MDTIKVAWMSKAKAKKLSVSIPWGSLHVSTLQGGGGGLLSHSMLRIKSLLIFQEAHSPILPFAHLLLFHSSPLLSVLSLSFLYHEWISSLQTEKNRPNEFSFFPSRPCLPRKIFTTIPLCSLCFPAELVSPTTPRSTIDSSMISSIRVSVDTGWWYRDPRRVCVEFVVKLC